MRKRRVSGIKSKTHSARLRGKSHLKPQLKPVRFLGLKLGGGKNDRTSLVVLDYYKSQNKIFLTHVYEHIQADDDVSSDYVLYDLIQQNLTSTTEFICVDFPLSFPKCVTCKLKCPGYESCKEKEIQWMWKQYKNQKKKKPNSKIFTPYTQRVVDYYLSTEFGQPMEALGANSAPITSRGQFLVKRLRSTKFLEINSPLSVLRLGSHFKIAKSHLLYYKHSVGGEDSRQVILEQLIKQDLVFVYQQDYMRLIHNSDVFEAFFNALGGYLKHQGLTENKPEDVPLAQGWAEFPKEDLEKF